MNLDVSSTINFGNIEGLRSFFLDHRVIHDITAQALTAKYKNPFSSAAISAPQAEEAWVGMIRNKRGPTPQVLADWLRLHAYVHIVTFQTISGTGTQAPDLSVVDFSKPDQFYDWMYVHQQMHDYEQQTLGIWP